MKTLGNLNFSTIFTPRPRLKVPDLNGTPLCAGTRISNSVKPHVGSCQHQDNIHPLGLLGADLLGL